MDGALLGFYYKHIHADYGNGHVAVYGEDKVTEHFRPTMVYDPEKENRWGNAGTGGIS